MLACPVGPGRHPLGHHRPGLHRRDIRVFNIIGGSLLVLVGAFMLSRLWMLWMYQLQNLAGTFTTPV